MPSFYRRHRVWLAALLLSTSGVALADAPNPAPSAGPDDSEFTIPDVVVPDGGFGNALSQACEAVAKFKDPPAGPSAREAGSRASSAKSQTDDLRAVCKAIAANALTDPNLVSLRAFRDGGKLIDITSALLDTNSRPDKSWDSLAAEIEKPNGSTTQGKVGSSEALSGVESRVIEGLADFLVTRTKEEAILYLQEQIKERFCKNVDFETLLPRVCDTLGTLDATVSIAAIGTALNGAARRDIEALPDGALKLGSKHDRANYFVYEPMRLLFAVITQVARGRSPKALAVALHKVAQRSCESAAPGLADAETTRCRQVFSAIRVASAALYAAQMNHLDGQAPAELAGDRPLLVGTLLDAEKVYSDAKVSGELKADTITRATQYVVDAVQFLAILDDAVKALRVQDKNSLSGEERRRRLATAAVDLVAGLARNARDWLSLINSAAPLPSEVNAGFDMADNLSVVGQDLVAEQYGAAIADFRVFIVHLQGHHLLAPTDAKGKAAIAAWVTGLGRFAPLVAELAAAPSSKDVATALEAAAAPAGSYKAKYERPSLALNAAVGVLGGAEMLRVPSPVGGAKTSNASGMVAGFAALGVHATTPFCEREAGGYWFHGGLLLSVLDLGALTTQRFNDQISDTQRVDQEPNIGVGQIFSPGAYFTLGLGHSPFLLGAGVSFAPALRTVTSTVAPDTTTSKDVAALRYGGFVAMDLTLLPF